MNGPTAEDMRSAAILREARLKLTMSRWHELAVSMGYDGVEPALLSLQAMERGPRTVQGPSCGHSNPNEPGVCSVCKEWRASQETCGGR